MVNKISRYAGRISNKRQNTIGNEMGKKKNRATKGCVTEYHIKDPEWDFSICNNLPSYTDVSKQEMFIYEK